MSPDPVMLRITQDAAKAPTKGMRSMRIKHQLAGLRLVLAISVGGLITGCSGGSSANGVGAGAGLEQNPTPDPIPSVLTLSGTAATVLAIAAAVISAKCQVGSGSATTAEDGRFQIKVTGGTLPCLLQTTE